MGGVFCIDAFDVRTQPEFRELEKLVTGDAAVARIFSA
jgi:hypothetical protein